ncbi:MAG: hypothetical protein ACTSUN_10800 [Promethearchaeota archaeon]
MGAVKNMVQGFLVLIPYVVFTIIVPYILFTYIYELTSSVQDHISLGMSAERYQQITFWILALGLVICGFAFLAFSSPKHSVRRGVFRVAMVFFNCLYIWIYALSSATVININIMNLLTFTIDLTGYIMFFMGIYFFSIIVQVIKLLQFITEKK